MHTLNSEKVDTVSSKTTPELPPIVEVDESLVSKYCVVKYDGKGYPRLIFSVDGEEELEVKTMRTVCRNRSF